MIQTRRSQHGKTPISALRAGAFPRMGLLLLVGLAVGSLASCAKEPDTLLQIDVRVPAGVPFTTLHFTIGDGEVRSYRVAARDAGADLPDADAPGADASSPGDASSSSDAGARDANGDGARDTAPARDAATDAARDAGAAVDGPRDIRPAIDAPRDATTSTPDAGRRDGGGTGGSAGSTGAGNGAAGGGGGVATPDAGAALGIDMLLPRRLHGPQLVVVRALDGADCVVAAKTVTVVLTPGTRVVADPVELALVIGRDCNWRPDAGGGAAGAGGADAGGDGPVEAAVDVGPPPPQACQAQGTCGSGDNCVAQFCAPAPATCAELAADDATLKDGVYWLAPGTAAPAHAYCDMAQKVVLCADTAGEHTGQTRDTSHLRFALRSVLEVAAGTCKIWAVRDVAQGIPLDELLDYQAAGSPSKTCAALGFKADVSLGACPYGSDPNFDACGFAVSVPFYKWSNNCDCGTMPAFYEKEGIVYNSHIPWDVSGAYFSRCTVR